jgi:hypothetical protein
MFDFSVFGTAEGWISLLSLSAMEIVLGIDSSRGRARWA